VTGAVAAVSTLLAVQNQRGTMSLALAAITCIFGSIINAIYL